MQVVRLTVTLAVGGLVSLDMISGTMIATSDTRYRLLSIKGLWSWQHVTQIDGALIFGIAASGYSAANIEEWMESSTSINQGSRTANEQADRKIRQIGIMPPTTTTGSQNERTLNDGRPIKTRVNWATPIGAQPSMWAYNASDENYTTGSLLSFQGQAVVKYS